jgi:hypothetical protein
VNKRWWIVTIRGKYLGKSYETEQAMRATLGQYITIIGNHINVWGRP